jgi:hypothetical protein
MRKNLLGIVKNEHPHPSQKSSERSDVMRKTKRQIKTPALHYSPRYYASSRNVKPRYRSFFESARAKSFLNRERERCEM